MQLQYISIARLVIDAGGDPWAINDSLQAGRPPQISDLAQAFHDSGQSTTESNAAFEEARRRFAASWNQENGQHPINDSAEVQRVTKSLGLQAAQQLQIAVDLENIAAALAEAQRESGWYISALEQDLADIDDEIGEALDDGDEDDANDLYEDAVEETNAVLYQVTQIRDAHAAILQNALAVLRADGGDPAGIKGADELLIPPPDTNPEQVKRWWDSLSEEQKRLLIDQHPQELGNLNGIAADVRGHVNLDVMNDDLHRVEDVAGQFGLSPHALRDNALHDENNDVFTNPEKYGLTATDITRYRNAVKTDKGLEHDRGDSKNPRPVMLWAYDPVAFNGKGRAAIAIGNPDKARNTAVIVPGTNSSVKGGWLFDGHNDAINLYSQSLKADPHQPTAVIAWMGYDAPEFDFQHPEQALADPTKLQQVGSPWLAREGGALLAADVNGLAVTHDGSIPSHVTVIGHSYGSTTVADAFANSGMHANDAVLIGCPGTDIARSAADFHLNGGQVYVGAASTDAISWIGESGSGAPSTINDALGDPLGPLAGLGTDPAHSGFGSVRFRAEVAGTHSVVPWFNDHSHYYDMGSEALHNMTEISTDHGGDLANQGMLAPFRDEERISTPTEVKTPFGAIPLPHVEIRAPIAVDPEWDRQGNSVTRDHDFK
jgi:Alpha/beta hydrolase